MHAKPDRAANHPPSGTVHLYSIHHPEHPRARSEFFMRLHGRDEIERVSGKMHRHEMISPLESLHRMLDGNKEHAREFESFLHSGGQMPKKIKCLVVVCADARMGGMFRFDDFANGTAVVYVAGNVADVFSTTEIAKLMKRLDRNATVLMCGHAKCGAVENAKKLESFRAPKFERIRHLLSCVDSHHEHANLEMQARIVRQRFAAVLNKHAANVITAFVDISEEHGQRIISITEPNSIISGAQRELVARMNEKFLEANAGQDLSAHQYAHAVVITDPSLGFGAREIFSLNRANEIFCVAAGASAKGIGGKGANAIATAEMAQMGLLDSSIGSAEYSVIANSSRHIVLMHHDISVIDKWEEVLLAKSQIIREALVAGEVEITSMVYDVKTGIATPMRHLVSQAMANGI